MWRLYQCDDLVWNIIPKQVSGASPSRTLLNIIVLLGVTCREALDKTPRSPPRGDWCSGAACAPSTSYIQATCPHFFKRNLLSSFLPIYLQVATENSGLPAHLNFTASLFLCFIHCYKALGYTVCLGNAIQNQTVLCYWATERSNFHKK